MNKSKIWKWPHPHLPEILQSPEFYRKCDKGVIIRLVKCLLEKWKSCNSIYTDIPPAWWSISTVLAIRQGNLNTCMQSVITQYCTSILTYLKNITQCIMFLCYASAFNIYSEKCSTNKTSAFSIYPCIPTHCIYLIEI